jgi:hypothetical protein
LNPSLSASPSKLACVHRRQINHLLRFPNPGSDIPSFILTFQVLYEHLGEQAVVTRDDMSAAMVKQNRASSCGFMGEEALKRSTREDRCRDPMYNQSKMYSELYRMLGWFRSTPRYPLMPVLSSFPLCLYSRQPPVFPYIPPVRYSRKLDRDALGDIFDKMLCSSFAFF